MSTGNERDRLFQCVMPTQKVASFSLNPARNLVAVGGRDAFNLVEIHPTMQLKKNLRNKQVVARGVGMTYAVADCRWHPKDEGLIATISPSGALVLWTLGDKPSSMFAEYHKRFGTSLSWSRFDPHGLFSVALDNTMGIWDTRTFDTGKPHTVVNFPSSSCREVSCNPLRQYAVAVAVENGYLHVYDTRRIKTPVKELCVHSSQFFVDWHPQVGDAICTGSTDHWLSVWDLSRPGNHPLHKIQSIASISRIHWRPNQSETSTSFATLSTLVDQDIRIWDVKAPYAPTLCFKHVHKDAVVDMKWLGNDGNRILSCSQDGWLRLSHISEATPNDEKPNTTVAWINTHGAVAAVHSITENLPTPPVTARPAPPPPQPAPAPPKSGGLFSRIFPREPKQSSASATPHGDSPDTATSIFGNRSFTTATHDLEPHKAQRMRSVVEMVKVDSISTRQFKKYALEYALPTHKDKRTAMQMLKHNAGVAHSIGDDVTASMWLSLSTVLEAKDESICADLTTSYLEVYCDSGDLQHCTHIYIAIVVVGGIPLPKTYNMTDRVLEWILGYMERLDTFRLQSVSTAVARSSNLGAVHDAARSGLMGSETFNIICSCGGRFTSSQRCGQCCTPMNMCAICQQQCQGLYVWFRACGHGGCASHVAEWIQYCKEVNEAAVCPTCGTALQR
eukprot:PhM_4_TR5062/c0_g1_i1/m.96877/K20408/WDR24; WD repeat-containing protein 24